MSVPLLSPSQLAAIQAVALPQFTTPAVVKRPTFGANTLGDDAITSTPTIGTVYGWLSAAPAAEPGIAGGDLSVNNTYRFGCAIGSNIKPRDLMVINGLEYMVTDTNPDETWPVMLSCTLRLSK